MLCYVMLSQPEKVSKQYGCAKVCRNSLILLNMPNISSNIVWYLLILSNIVECQSILSNIVIFCPKLSVIFKPCYVLSNDVHDWHSNIFQYCKILIIISWYCLILLDIVKHHPILLNNVTFCLILSIIFKPS